MMKYTLLFFLAFISLNSKAQFVSPPVRNPRDRTQKESLRLSHPILPGLRRRLSGIGVPASILVGCYQERTL